MKFLKYSPIAVLVLVYYPSVLGDDWLRSVPEFELTDHLGDVHTLEDYEKYDLAVFYVQGVGCPIARIALPNYREVRDEYAGKPLLTINSIS